MKVFNSEVTRAANKKLISLINENGSEIIKSSLEEGIDYSRTFHTVAMKGNLEVVDILITHGVDIDSYCEGRSALHRAAIKGHKEIIELLIKHNVKIDSVDKNGCTPLNHACIKGHNGIITYLLENGANPLAEPTIDSSDTPKLKKEKEYYIKKHKKLNKPIKEMLDTAILVDNIIQGNKPFKDCFELSKDNAELFVSVFENRCETKEISREIFLNGYSLLNNTKGIKADNIAFSSDQIDRLQNSAEKIAKLVDASCKKFAKNESVIISQMESNHKVIPTPYHELKSNGNIPQWSRKFYDDYPEYKTTGNYINDLIYDAMSNKLNLVSVCVNCDEIHDSLSKIHKSGLLPQDKQDYLEGILEVSGRRKANQLVEEEMLENIDTQVDGQHDDIYYSGETPLSNDIE